MSVMLVTLAGLAQVSLMGAPDYVQNRSLESDGTPALHWSFDRVYATQSIGAVLEDLTTNADTAQDTQIFEYSDGYYARLNIHRKASYAMFPLFVAQFIAGEQLLTKGRFAPGWAKTTHRPLAFLVGGLFAVNTVTGAMNLSESARDPNRRTKRTLHALMMFAADVGFVFTGILAPSTNSIEQRLAVGDTSWTPHKYVAVSSMGLAAASWLLMVLWNG